MSPRLLNRGRSFVLVHTVLFAGISCAAYPDKPITLIVPFDPGSTSDLIARTLAAGAEKALGARLVIENHGGGGGTVGMAILANAARTLYVAVGPSDVVAHTRSMLKVPYKPLKSFTPIIAMDAVANHRPHREQGCPLEDISGTYRLREKNPGKIKYSTMGWVRPCTLRWSSSRRRTDQMDACSLQGGLRGKNRHDGAGMSTFAPPGPSSCFCKGRGHPRLVTHGRSAPPSSPTFQPQGTGL